MLMSKPYFKQTSQTVVGQDTHPLDTESELNGLSVSESALQAAVEKLQGGELVAFPTETVYGLGADAENPQAVSKIYQAKGRPQNHPVIVHVAPDADMSYWVKSVPEEARQLIKAFWPGPLTLILTRADHIPDAVSGGQASIGIRCPSHPIAQALLRRFAALKPSGQGGVAAPSANKFGHVSPTRAEHVRNEFPKEIAQGMIRVLEGGATEVGIESTILDLSRLEEGVGAVLLRPGHILPEQIASVLGYMPARPDLAAPRVSGSLKAHYAPNTPLQLMATHNLAQDISALVPTGEKWAMLVFEPRNFKAEDAVHWYGVSMQAQEYAHDLYALLRRLDSFGYDRICVQTPPDESQWEALNDRLQRAAAAFDAA